MGQMGEIGKEFWVVWFWGKIQRRGVHVSPPKRGSRAGELCFGGILGFNAEL
jgi:hypothetical protein